MVLHLGSSREFSREVGERPRTWLQGDAEERPKQPQAGPGERWRSLNAEVVVATRPAGLCRASMDLRVHIGVSTGFSHRTVQTVSQRPAPSRQILGNGSQCGNGRREPPSARGQPAAGQPWPRPVGDRHTWKPGSRAGLTPWTWPDSPAPPAPGSGRGHFRLLSLSVKFTLARCFGGRMRRTR